MRSSARTALRGLAVTDHVVDVPLRWDVGHGRPVPATGPVAAADPGPTLQVLAREVVDVRREHDDLPVLLFLQGGPGGKSPRPVPGQGWLARATRTHRVVLLDQRGTGRSTRVDASRVDELGPPGPGRDAALAEHLRHHRADAVVADAEHVRHSVYGGRRWESLGQSYGGFLTLTYLSRAPHGLAACYVTGGLAGLTASADEVYARLYPRVLERGERHRARFPGDGPLLDALAERLDAEDVRLPSGDRLTTRRLQSLGIALGRGDGSDELHWMLDEAFRDGPAPTDGPLAPSFLAAVEQATSHADGPLYVVVHESIYAQGRERGQGPTAWAAQRLLPDALRPGSRPLGLLGETTYPWQLEETRALRPFRGAAELLHAADDWEPLYDLDVLVANEVPLAALAYHDDLYVDVDLSLTTARAVGSTDVWVTNEWQHDGLRASGGAVLDRLLASVADRGGPLR
ncbi:alpha/beta fold hydrolase [Pseudokineococcus basanitobsidens]|uniref:alpha/beta fold hydrolase n=1 Tax=Pseudokineococcus basanitobsidens TaxID=1926649 RepID=UPI003BB505FE